VSSETAQQRIYFSVASALLRNLESGSRSPHIALAELIKNSYDADARRVHSLQTDGIELVDNGHGMTLEEFQGTGSDRITNITKIRFSRTSARP